MRLLLLGEDHRVLVDTQDLLVGQQASRNLWDMAAPIVVQGTEVGRLASGSMLSGANTRTALETAFLRTTRAGPLDWQG